MRMDGSIHHTFKYPNINKPGTLCYDLCHVVVPITSRTMTSFHGLLCMFRSASLTLLFACWTCQDMANKWMKTAGCSQVEVENKSNVSYKAWSAIRFSVCIVCIRKTVLNQQKWWVDRTVNWCQIH